MGAEWLALLQSAAAVASSKQRWQGGEWRVESKVEMTLMDS